MTASQGTRDKTFIYCEANTHRDDLPAHPHRFMPCVTEEVPIHGNGFPMVLVSPASIITEKKVKLNQ